jgi:hypothetical protein
MLELTAYFQYLVPLIAEVNDGHTETQLRSGFLVDIEGVWIWFTAAHCAEDITAICKLGTGRIGLCSFADEGKPRVEIPTQLWAPIDCKAKVRELQESGDFPDLTDQHVENFDLALWVIPVPYNFYLINAGLRPLTLDQFLPDQQTLAELIHTQEKYFFALGLPHVNVVESDFDKVTVTPIAFPLHPSPDSPIDLEPREIYFEPALTYIPIWLSRDEWKGDVQGVSGGPVLLVINGEPALMGVATHQQPYPPRTARYIGSTDAWHLLAFLRKTIVELKDQPTP